jgi:hypothetical protein
MPLRIASHFPRSVILALVFVALDLPTCTVGADASGWRSEAPNLDKPDFSGTWVFNASKSALDPRFKVAEGTFVLEQEGRSFRFSRTFVIDGKPDSLSFELTIDGPEKTEKGPDRTAVSRLYWEGDTLVFTSRTTLNDGREASDVVRYTLEDGGRTFVAEESFRAPRLMYDNRWVADRKK